MKEILPKGCRFDQGMIDRQEVFITGRLLKTHYCPKCGMNIQRLPNRWGGDAYYRCIRESCDWQNRERPDNA